MTMKKMKTIVVIGGGYAGINLIEALEKKFHKEINEKIRVILVDKIEYHFKKVKLFKGIVNEDVSNLYIPLKRYCGKFIEFIQGKLTGVNTEEQTIYITGDDGTLNKLAYDYLVLAAGSVLREVDPKCGGFPLVSLENAKDIRQHLLRMADSTKRNIRLVIAGSGITGIETAAEVGSWLKDEGETRRTSN
jgi:NADH:ubiquinone reductase (H+-translocating)